jgi:hypothetical protein
MHAWDVKYNCKKQEVQFKEQLHREKAPDAVHSIILQHQFFAQYVPGLESEVAAGRMFG